MTNQISLGLTLSHDEKRIASIFLDKRSKGQRYEVRMSNDGLVRTQYAWTVFEACDIATDFVSDK